MEELREFSEVAWPEEESRASDRITTTRSRRPSASCAASPPVDIPSSGKRRGFEEEEEEDGDDQPWAPPHVLASRRWAGERKVAFSLCSGQGRTLKGRDLRHVRDAVLRMTGFLEG